MTPSRTLSPFVSYTLAHSPWVVERIEHLDDFLQRWRRLERHGQGAFQHSGWLHSWYTVMASAHPQVEPLLLAARAQGEALDALLMPMIVRRKGLAAVVEAADLGHAGWVAPIARAGFELSEGDAQALGRALRDALRGYDLLQLDKLPQRAGAGHNPWLQLFAAEPCGQLSLRLPVPDPQAGPTLLRGPAEGLDLDRCWRHFQCAPEARLVRACGVDEGLRLLRQMLILQHRRHARPSAPALPPTAIELHEHFLREQLQEGRCVMTALMSRDEMVAGMLGAFDGRCLTLLRGAGGSERWSSCAPRSLLLDRTMRLLQPLGCTQVELGGDEAWLGEVFGAERVPLWRSRVALSLLGQVHAIARRVHSAPKRPATETGAA